MIRTGTLLVAAMALVSIGFTVVGVPIGIATLDQYGPTGLIFIVIFPAIALSLTFVGAFVAAAAQVPHAG